MSHDLGSMLREELGHLRASWWCFLLLGILLAVCGAAAITVPACMVATSLVAVIILGVSLMIGGIGEIVTTIWVGRSSGALLHVLVGLMYVVAGFVITEKPGASLLALTVFVAASFIVLGAFRIAASLLIRFPQWGWSLLNGVITLLLGVMIYRHLPGDALWVIGLLVGLDLLFNGWTWIMLSIALTRLPKEANSQATG